MGKVRTVKWAYRLAKATTEVTAILGGVGVPAGSASA